MGFSRDASREEVKIRKKSVTSEWRSLQRFPCNDIFAMAWMQWLRCNGFWFSSLPIFTNKATIIPEMGYTGKYPPVFKDV